MESESTRRPGHGSRSARTALWVLLVVTVAATILLTTAAAPPGPEGDPISLELTTSARAFAETFSAGWREDVPAWCGVGAEYDPEGTGLGTLRCHLAIDSLLYVPGYVGLLAFFTLSLGRAGTGSITGILLALCAPVAAAGTADVIENALAVEAAGEYLDGTLTDTMVEHVRLASLAKWSLVALALLIVAGYAWRAAARARHLGAVSWPLHAASAGAALSAIATLTALAVGKQGLLAPGMVCSTATVGLLAWWRLSRQSDWTTRGETP